MTIYLLAFLSFFFCLFGFRNDPHIGKFLVCGSILLLAKPIVIFKLQRLHWLFFGFLGWCFICCFFSPFPSMSFYGHHWRMEGLITYAFLTSMAWMYWTVHVNYKPIQLYVGMVLCIIGILYLSVPYEQFCQTALFAVALGGVISASAVAFWAINPLFLIGVFPFMLVSNTRTSLIAIASSIICYQLLKMSVKQLNKYFFLLILAFVAVIPFTPLGSKLASIDICRIGLGARTQWILQASDLAYSLPLTGYGLDTLSKYLELATSNYMQPNAVPDKTHCIIFDIILQVGWIGYTMALLIFGMALWIATTYRTNQNVLCFSMLVGWLVFNMINPSSYYSTLFAIWAIFGLTEPDNKIKIKG